MRNYSALKQREMCNIFQRLSTCVFDIVDPSLVNHQNPEGAGQALSRKRGKKERQGEEGREEMKKEEIEERGEGIQ